MATHPDLVNFSKLLEKTLQEGTFTKLNLSKVAGRTDELKMIYVSPVKLNSGFNVSFTYRYKTKDQVKNYTVKESLTLLNELLGVSFHQALLVCPDKEYQLLTNKKGKAKLITKEKKTNQGSLSHNKEKNYLIQAKNNTYLYKLGVCDASGRIKDKQQDKFRQINRYVELMSHWFVKMDITKEINIVDMGSGKGYLTFALYDYLKNHLKLNVSMIGVELRESLVKLCNDIRTDCGFENLKFLSKDINDFDSSQIDILIALHACDTATDLAIFKGICAKAELIVCAPCCHKQVRKEMETSSDFKALTKHGIFEERQAEMLTDAIRSLLMEREGYQTKIFEFISNEHTRKNVMLVGRKLKKKRNKNEFNDEINRLKDSFKIQRHELEDLLGQL